MTKHKTVSTRQLDYLAGDIADNLMRSNNPAECVHRLQRRGLHEEDYGGLDRETTYRIIRNHIEEFWSVNR